MNNDVIQKEHKRVSYRLKSLTSEGIEKVFSNVPTDGLKVGKFEQVCCAQPLLYFIGPTNVSGQTCLVITFRRVAESMNG